MTKLNWRSDPVCHQSPTNDIRSLKLYWHYRVVESNFHRVLHKETYFSSLCWDWYIANEEFNFRILRLSLNISCGCICTRPWTKVWPVIFWIENWRMKNLSCFCAKRYHAFLLSRTTVSAAYSMPKLSSQEKCSSSTFMFLFVRVYPKALHSYSNSPLLWRISSFTGTGLLKLLNSMTSQIKQALLYLIFCHSLYRATFSNIAQTEAGKNCSTSQIKSTLKNFVHDCFSV